jgi:DNA alkylation repair enzyme
MAGPLRVEVFPPYNIRMTPSQLANRTVQILKKSGNKKDAEGIRRYFKQYEKVLFYGVKSPRQREIERELFLIAKPEWDVSNAIDFCSILIQNPVHECKNVGLMFLGRYRRHFDKRLFTLAETWLRKDYCASWALVDLLSPLILTPLILEYPSLLNRLKGWRKSKNLWMRRASAVALIPAARHGQLHDPSYETVLILRKDSEDLIHKATGWLLREAGKTDPERLKRFLAKHGVELPRTTIRYAIERFPKPLQKRILVETRERRFA